MRRRHLVTLAVAALLIAGAAGASVAAENRQCPDDAVIYDPEAGISEPVVITKVNPIYPDDAKKEEISGVVVLDAVIDVEGAVVQVQVLQDPHPSLTEAATDAVRQWRFKAATDEGGKAIKVCRELTVSFKLE